jgi:hypothetical protein
MKAQQQQQVKAKSQSQPQSRKSLTAQPALAHSDQHSGKKHKRPQTQVAHVSSTAAVAARAAAPAVAASASPRTLLSSLTTPDSTFSALLGPSISSSDFFCKYFERQPLHISRSKNGASKEGRNFYKGLFSKAMFDSYLRANADELQYGFNLNICVCSEEGKKIDMNPKLEGEEVAEEAKEDDIQLAEDDQMEEGEDGSEDEEAAASAPTPPPSKKQKTSRLSSSKKPPAPVAEEEVETMTIAQALALAESQRATLKPSAAAATAEEEEEDEEDDDASDEDAGSEEDQDDNAEDELSDGQEDEEQLDGTSVSTIRRYAPVRYADYERLYASGCTIQALQPQQYNEASWRLLAQLESLFGGLAGANVYITPPNSQGLGQWHGLN